MFQDRIFVRQSEELIGLDHAALCLRIRQPLIRLRLNALPSLACLAIACSTADYRRSLPGPTAN